MVDVKVRQQHIVQILRLNAHVCQLLVDCHPLRYKGMKERCHLRRENRGCRPGVVHAIRAYLPAPAGIHKDQSLRVLDQIGENGKRDPVLIRCSELLCGFDQIKPLAKGNGRIDADASALQHMNLHGIILFYDCVRFPRYPIILSLISPVSAPL